MIHIGTILSDLGATITMCARSSTCIRAVNASDLHENLVIRSSFFPDPGPATTGIPLPALAYPDMVIEIDVFAMKETGGIR